MTSLRGSARVEGAVARRVGRGQRVEDRVPHGGGLCGQRTRGAVAAVTLRRERELAAAQLAVNLDQMGFFPRTHAVWGAMADKDLAGILRAEGRKQLKGVLRHQGTIAGIGNAYSDEILWAAGLHPHRRRATMTDEDLRRLYGCMRTVLEESIQIVDATVQAEGLGKKEEWREHLKVHRRGGQPCPRCGSEIRSQVRSGSETNYCVPCQPLFEEQRAEGAHA